MIQSAKDSDSDKATILLVEDEEPVRRVTVRLLTKLGYVVLATATAQEAIDLFAERGSEIDLVLTDVVMPGLTGVELAEVLRDQHAGLKVLFMSGYASRELGSQLPALPGPFLLKPFSLDQLSESVRQALAD